MTNDKSESVLHRRAALANYNLKAIGHSVMGRDQWHTANLSSAICHLSYRSAAAEWSAVPALKYFFALESFGREENTRASQY